MEKCVHADGDGKDDDKRSDRADDIDQATQTGKHRDHRDNAHAEPTDRGRHAEIFFRDGARTRDHDDDDRKDEEQCEILDRASQVIAAVMTENQ